MSSINVIESLSNRGFIYVSINYSKNYLYHYVDTYFDKLLELSGEDVPMRNYQGVCLPNELLYRIDQTTEGMGYTSRTDFIKQAIRRELERICKSKVKQ